MLNSSMKMSVGGGGGGVPEKLVEPRAIAESNV